MVQHAARGSDNVEEGIGSDFAQRADDTTGAIHARAPARFDGFRSA